MKHKKCSNPNCPNGAKLQPFSNFQVWRQTRDGRSSRCKDCVKAYIKTPARRKVKMLMHAQTRAKKENLPCSITLNDFDIPAHCPFLGIKLVHGVGRQEESSPTLDKLIPSRGYVPGNVLVISQRANRIKTNASWEEILKVGLALRKTMRKRCPQQKPPNG